MCFHSHSYTMASDRETSTIKIRRKPSLKEKEHNMMRERKRRAITTKIFKGLRAQGNYNLSRHCDNNEVLKALCAEAGWLVEGDGTTYRKGYNDAGTSTRTTPFSYSQNPSPISLSFPTSIPSYQFTPLSFPPLWISNNAPVTPLNSPTSTDLKPIPTWDSISKEYVTFFNYPFVASSTLASPKHQNLHTPMKFQAFAQSSFAVPSSSTFNVVADNSIREMRSSKMLGVQIKPWVGEKVHDDGLDDLELTLGTGKGRI